MNERIPLILPRACGGALGRAVIRTLPEDFQVTEIPLVAPDGEGEHCWLYVRKRNSNTPWVASRLADFAGVSPRAVSYAGMKDRNAVTEQWFSVQLPGQADPNWQAIDNDDFEVLEAKRHSRKLKTGALRGNRFQLRLRGVAADPTQVEARLEQLQQGVPNSFGPQRFGRGGDNLVQAERLLARPKARVSRSKRSIWLSAVRSALFNRVLAARIEAGNWNAPLAGDAFQLEGKSAVFSAPQVDDDIQARAANGDIHPTGPLCGSGDPMVSGAAAELEQATLEPYRDWIEGLDAFRMKHARRALRVMPGDLIWSQQEDDQWLLGFSLPAGSYATSLLYEVFEVKAADESG
ncbi:MAG: tRNA pseudouridine(13) synthase TruD [Gammaproteobacteria bacterium]|nr:MAG: tRNA pseudouridine(13) synthase TruD [Gammaproteobacteria bacterium]